MPTANAVNAAPAQIPDQPSSSTTNSGANASRTPYAVQPFRKFEVNAARKVGSRHGAANRGAGSSGAARTKLGPIRFRSATTAPTATAINTAA